MSKSRKCEHGMMPWECSQCENRSNVKLSISDGLQRARDKSSKLIHRAMQINKTTDQELLKLIYDDLKMRADDDGVVNISGFIWDKLSRHVNDA